MDAAMNGGMGLLGRENYPIVPLEELCDLCSGITKGRKNGSTVTVEVPYMAVANVQDGSLKLDNVKTIEATHEEIHRYRLLPGDLLLTEGGDPDKLGRGAIWNGEITSCIHQNHIFRARKASEYVDMEYLAHLVSSPYGKRYFLRQSKQTTGIASINMGQLKRFPVPLPPLEEQRHIAAILDKAAQVRCLLAKKELAIASLMQSVFVEVFGHPQEASVGSQAPVVTLGECCTLFSGGTLPAGEDNTGQEGGFLLLKVSDMNLPGNERSLKTSNLWSPKPGANSATCPAGSVVIPKRGGAIGTNKKRVVDRDAVLDPNLMALAPKEGMMTTEYLFGWFSFLDLSSITSGSSVPQLNKQDLSPLKVVLPPVEAQSKYKEIALRVSLMSESLRTEVIFLQTLSQGLQRAAFGSANPE